MTNMPLDVALAALLRQAGQGLSADIIGDTVQVDIAAVVRIDGDEVRWVLAEPEDSHVHHLQFAVNLRSSTTMGSSREHAPYYDDDIPMGEALDSVESDRDLPPITRPKPGVEGARHGR